MSDIFLNAFSRSTGKILDVPYPSAGTEESPNRVVIVQDRTSYTLAPSTSNTTTIIDNRVGNDGVTTIYVDPTSEVGSRWKVYVLYGTNGSITGPPPYTSLVVTYGANDSTIDVIRNIADFQSILIVPDSNSVVLTIGNVEVDDPNDTRLIGIPNKFLLLGTVTPTTIYSPPTVNYVAQGTPTLTNYGVAMSLIEVVYMGVQTNPTFLYNVENTYYPILNE
jgi:hypothetical protein